MTSRRKLALLMLLATILTLAPLERIAAAEENDYPAYVPWMKLDSHVGVLRQDTLYAGSSEAKLTVYDIDRRELVASLPIDAPLASIALHSLERLYGVSSKGTFYSFDLTSSIPTVEFALQLGEPSSGQSWDLDQVGPLQRYLGSNPPLYITVLGNTVYAIDPISRTLSWSRTFTGGLLQEFCSEWAVSLVEMADGKYFLTVLGDDGSLIKRVPASPVIPDTDPGLPEEQVYYVNEDGKTIMGLNLANGQVAERFSSEETITSLAMAGGHIITYQGNTLWDYDRTKDEIVAGYYEAAPGTVFGAVTGGFRSVNAETVSEYRDGRLTWSGSLRDGDNSARILSGSENHIIVRSRSGALDIFRSSEQKLTDNELQYGRLDEFIFDHPDEGPVSWNVHALIHPYLYVKYNIYLQAAGEETWTLLERGSFIGAHSPHFTSIPAGKIKLSVTPLLYWPFSDTRDLPQDGWNDYPQVYGLTLGEGLQADLHRPPFLWLLNDQGSQIELWGGQHITEYEMQVATDPGTEVTFIVGDDQPKVIAGQDGYASSIIPLDNMPATSIVAGIEEENQTSVVYTWVLRHLVTEDPRTIPQLSRQPGIYIRVPDVSAIDLAASEMKVANIVVPLYAHSQQNLVYGVPTSSLPTGRLPVQLTLRGIPETPGGEAPLLDSVVWPIDIIGHREAVLWPDKKTGVLNGESVQLDAAPYLHRSSSSTMIPFRYVADVMGAQVGWNGKTKQVTFKLEDRVIVLTIGNRTAYVNGKAVTMATAPAVLNGRTMVPLRFVTENLGATVHWNNTEKKITIKVAAAPIE